MRGRGNHLRPQASGESQPRLPVAVKSDPAVIVTKIPPGNQPMHVAVAHISLRVPESRSLKTRRQAARSLISRIRARFNVSVAQDAGADGNAWQSVTLAMSCVGVSADQTRSRIDEVVEFVSEVRPDLEVLDYQIEVMSGF